MVYSFVLCLISYSSLSSSSICIFHSAAGQDLLWFVPVSKCAHPMETATLPDSEISVGRFQSGNKSLCALLSLRFLLGALHQYGNHPYKTTGVLLLLHLNTVLLFSTSVLWERSLVVPSEFKITSMLRCQFLS